MRRAPSRPLLALFAGLLFASLAIASTAGCENQEPQFPPPPCQPGACPPGQWPAMPPTPEPIATATGTMPPFVGLPCIATEDIVCGWGKCIAGRCGGCQTNDDCKPGGACGWTPIGMACMYGGGPR